MGIQKLALVVKSGIMVEKQFEPKMFQFNCELSYIVSVFGSSPGGYSLIWAIKVCAAPKGMVFQPFWS